METDKILASDGVALTASVFRAPSPKATVVIGSATGVPRRFYHPFAQFLSEGGLSTVTFDYRGIGDSRQGPSRRRDPSRMRDWGLRDVTAALSFAASLAPTLPRLYVGHSVGGQILGLAAGKEELRAALFVASQSGYWRHWPAKHRLLFASLWYAGIPVITAITGYLPMLVGGEDLPEHVARDWARWCRHPDYVLSDPAAVSAGYQSFDKPIRDYAIEDDSYAPRAAIDALLRAYARAPNEVRIVHPRDYGAKRIGHFGFFRERFRESLWQEAREWLLARIV